MTANFVHFYLFAGTTHVAGSVFISTWLWLLLLASSSSSLLLLGGAGSAPTGPEPFVPLSAPAADPGPKLARNSSLPPAILVRTDNESFTAWYMMFLICNLSSWLECVSESSRNSWVRWKQCETFSGETKSSATFMQLCKLRTYNKITHISVVQNWWILNLHIQLLKAQIYLNTKTGFCYMDLLLSEILCKR